MSTSKKRSFWILSIYFEFNRRWKCDGKNETKKTLKIEKIESMKFEMRTKHSKRRRNKKENRNVSIKLCAGKRTTREREDSIEYSETSVTKMRANCIQPKLEYKTTTTEKLNSNLSFSRCLHCLLNSKRCVTLLIDTKTSMTKRKIFALRSVEERIVCLSSLSCCSLCDAQ